MTIPERFIPPYLHQASASLANEERLKTVANFSDDKSWKVMGSLLIKTINLSEYPALHSSLKDKVTTANPKALPDISAKAKELLFTDQEIAAAGTTNWVKQVTERELRLHQFAGVMGKYREDSNGLLQINNSYPDPLTYRVPFNDWWEPTTTFHKVFPIFLTTKTLLQLFTQIYEREFIKKDLAIRSEGILVQIEKKCFLVKIQDGHLHIFLESQSEQVGNSDSGCITKILDVSQGRFIALNQVWQTRLDKALVASISDEETRNAALEMMKDQARNEAIKAHEQRILQAYQAASKLRANEPIVFFDFKNRWGRRIIARTEMLYTTNLETFLYADLNPVKRLSLCENVVAAVQDFWKAGLVHASLEPCNFLLNFDFNFRAGGLKADSMLIKLEAHRKGGKYTVGLTHFSNARSLTERPPEIQYNPAYNSQLDQAELAKINIKDQARLKAAEEAIDIFQLGCLLHFILTGKLPYKKYDHLGYPDFLEKFCTKALKKNNCSNLLTDLISRMVDQNPKTRITQAEFNKEWAALVAGPKQEQTALGQVHVTADLPPPISLQPFSVLNLDWPPEAVKSFDDSESPDDPL